jgi:hypothetical protein
MTKFITKIAHSIHHKNEQNQSKEIVNISISSITILDNI